MGIEIVSKRIVVAGRVQGVWYRGSMQQYADQLGLVGWVKNLPDGRVEAVAEGPAEEVRALLRWCATGPPGARVAEVLSNDQPVSGFDEFSVRY
jgi:acylphosphatase